MSTAHPPSSTVPLTLFGGQYRKTDRPIIFFKGRGPLKTTTRQVFQNKEEAIYIFNDEYLQNRLKIGHSPDVRIITVIPVVTHHKD